jgi:hypothetical protein
VNKGGGREEIGMEGNSGRKRTERGVGEKEESKRLYVQFSDSKFQNKSIGPWKILQSCIAPKLAYFCNSTRNIKGVAI